MYHHSGVPPSCKLFSPSGVPATCSNHLWLSLGIESELSRVSAKGHIQSSEEQLSKYTDSQTLHNSAESLLSLSSAPG